MQAQKELDTRGLNCPLPILKAKKALADMVSGEVLRVRSLRSRASRAVATSPTVAAPPLSVWAGSCARRRARSSGVASR